MIQLNLPKRKQYIFQWQICVTIKWRYLGQVSVCNCSMLYFSMISLDCLLKVENVICQVSRRDCVVRLIADTMMWWCLCRERAEDSVIITASTSSGSDAVWGLCLLDRHLLQVHWTGQQGDGSWPHQDPGRDWTAHGYFCHSCFQAVRSVVQTLLFTAACSCF